MDVQVPYFRYDPGRRRVGGVFRLTCQQNAGQLALGEDFGDDESVVWHDSFKVGQVVESIACATTDAAGGIERLEESLDVALEVLVELWVGGMG